MPDPEIFTPFLGFFIMLIFPVVFIIFWVGISFLLAYLGGWARLAQYYEVRSPFAGQKWHMQSGRMGMTNYKGCLTVGVNESGLYLAVLPIFRAGHPPLFIPWYDITTAPSKQFFMSYLDFTFARVPSLRLRLPERFGNMVLSHRTDMSSNR